jgi:hypothetical protein
LTSQPAAATAQDKCFEFQRIPWNTRLEADLTAVYMVALGRGDPYWIGFEIDTKPQLALGEKV